MCTNEYMLNKGTSWVLIKENDGTIYSKHQQWKDDALLTVAFCIHYCYEFLNS